MALFYVFPVVFWLCFNGVFMVEATHKIYPHYQNLQGHLTVNHQSKPAYHFRPKYNWMSDPNGPMYYKGFYHFFYQYNPYGSAWGNIVWAHSVSKDLINWLPLEPAIYPSKIFDQYGCWSGSATILPGNKPIILYTGIIDKKNTQVQNYAVPANLSDPYLRKWIKPDNNPLIVGEPGVNASAFRDPTTAWFSNGHWRIGISSRRRERGVTLLYRSRDFIRWIKAKHPLYSAPCTGNWEASDFFPVSKNGNITEGLDTSVTGKQVKHVHKVSLDDTRIESYTIGNYYPEMRDKFVADENSVEGLRYDYGSFYASKSFFDPIKKRRILWGWTNESDSAEDDAAKGWAGVQLIPRKVWLDPNGKQLLQWPVEELETLRGEKISVSNKELKKGEKIEVKGITAAQADIEVTFSFGSLEKAETFDPRWEKLDAQDVCAKTGSFIPGGIGPFGLATLASKNLEEYTPVFFRIFKHGTRSSSNNNKYKVLMCSDATKSSLKDQGLYKPSFAGFVDVDLKDQKISLRTLIDHSVVESFGAKGKTCITSRVYPTIAIRKRTHLYVFNNGTENIKIQNLDAWSLQNALRMNTRTL